MEDTCRRTWAEIDLDNLLGNYRAIVARAGVPAMCVVKADAYGCGAVRVAQELCGAGCTYLAVACLSEAVELRRHKIAAPILILGYTPPQLTPLLVRHRLTQTVFSAGYAQEIAEKVPAGEKLTVHLKAETGMHRLGMDTPEELLRAAAYPQLAVEGIFTHFAVADGGPGDRVSQAYTEHQFEKFLALAGAVERGGVPLKLRHCCNSAAGMRYEAMRLDMVRPGIILYGQKPSPDCPDLPELRPVMELKSTVAQVRELREGETVGYGRHYTAPKSRRVATVTAGYADGFLRGNAGGEVLICGRRAPILGTICMDQLMADVTEIPEAAPGCTATLFGRDGGLFLDAEEVAARMNTISYEVLSGVGRRVPRFYRKDGAQSGSANDFLAEDLAESSGTLGE